MASPSGQVEQIPFTAAPRGAARRTGKRSYAVPLVVAVTGHRDLLPAEIPLIRTRVREFLASLRDAYPDRVVAVMSPLAEGADRLAAEEAITLGMPLTVPLPMPKEIYASDFATPQSKAHFEQLCAAAADVFELPLTPGNSVESIREHGKNRARQYAQAGVFLCAHCHVLLALWDGKSSGQLGGTSQVVRFHHHDVMPGYTPRATSSRLTLTDDESDLVYHIVCSRNRPDGAPAEGLVPLEASWFTTDEQHPRVREMPLQAQAGLRAGERVQPGRAGERRGHRSRAIPAADRRAGGRAAAGPAGHQPGVLRGRLAGDPLPEARDVHAARDPRRRAAHRPCLHLVHRHRVDPRPDPRHPVRDARDGRHRLPGEPRLLAPQVPRLPHARRGAARAVLLGRRRRHQRQRHEVRARQLPADAGPGPRVDPQRHARRRHRVRRGAQPRSGEPRVRAARMDRRRAGPVSSATTGARAQSAWPAT